MLHWEREFRNLVAGFDKMFETSFLKVQRGLVAPYVRCGLDYCKGFVGPSEEREAASARYVVQMRRFAELLGRKGLIARVLTWIKRHLATVVLGSSSYGEHSGQDA